MKKRGSFASPQSAKKPPAKRKPKAKAAPPLPLPRWGVRSIREVAEFFGCSGGTVDSWRENGCPGDAGRFDLSAIAQWVRARDKRRGGGENGASMSAQESEEKVKLLRARREAREFRNRIEQGKFMLVAEVERAVSRLIVQARDLLERVPATMAPRFPADVRQDLMADLGAEIGRTLTALAEWRPESGPADAKEATEAIE